MASAAQGQRFRVDNGFLRADSRGWGSWGEEGRWGVAGVCTWATGRGEMESSYVQCIQYVMTYVCVYIYTPEITDRYIDRYIDR